MRAPLVGLAIALAGAAPLAAQTVMEVQGGGSSLYDGYGASANLFRPDWDGWIGLGYQNGLRLGAFLRTTVGKDTLRLGSDALLVRFPTDLFTTGYTLQVTGASWTHVREGSSVTLFGGASADAPNAPTFQAANFRAPLTAVFASQRVSPTVTLFAHGQAAGAGQSAIGGVQYAPTSTLTTALAGGIGSNDPYGAASLSFRREGIEIRASYVYNPQRFRRLTVPAPVQTEADRENILVTVEPWRGVTIGAGRQNFLQDSALAGSPRRASGNTAFVGFSPGWIRVTAGLYDSRSDTISNVSSYVAVGRPITRWLDAEAYLLQSRPSVGAGTTTPIVNLRERVSSRLGLVQQLSLESNRPRIQVGGNLLTTFGEIGVDYQIVQQPFQPLKPFRSALTLSARLQLGSYTTRLATYIQPDGSVNYSASGSRFLYLGDFGGLAPRGAQSRPLDRFVVHGMVVDESGAPVDGAAIALDGDMAYSNAQGEFLVRIGRPKRMTVTVKLDEFLLPGTWEVVSAPEAVQAAREGQEEVVRVVLRRGK